MVQKYDRVIVRSWRSSEQSWFKYVGRIINMNVGIPKNYECVRLERVKVSLGTKNKKIERSSDLGGSKYL